MQAVLTKASARSQDKMREAIKSDIDHEELKIVESITRTLRLLETLEEQATASARSIQLGQSTLEELDLTERNNRANITVLEAAMAKRDAEKTAMEETIAADDTELVKLHKLR